MTDSAARLFPLDPPRRGRRTVAPAPEGAMALWLAELAAAASAGWVHVAMSETRAERLAAAAADAEPELEVLLLPPWDCLPYDRSSPSAAVMGRRAAVLQKLAPAPRRGGRLLVTTVEGFLQRVPDLARSGAATLTLAAGEALDLTALRRYLLRTGYVIDERVDEPGEAALRGSVVDLFPADADRPVRLDIADGTITAMRRYDAATQRSIAEIGALTLGPASELLLPEAAVDPLLAGDAGAGAREVGALQLSQILVEPLLAGRRRPGIEHWLPLAAAAPLPALLELLPDAALSLDPGVDAQLAAWSEQIAEAFRARLDLPQSGGEGRVPLEPERLYLSQAEAKAAIAARRGFDVLTDDAAGSAQDRLAVEPLPEGRDGDRGGVLVGEIDRRLAEGGCVVLSVGDAATQARLARRLRRRLPEAQPWAAARRVAGGTLAVARLGLLGGFVTARLTVVAAADLLGGEAAGPTGTIAEAPEMIPEIALGDAVVHIDHGVGRVRALESVGEGAERRDFLALDYSGEDRLLVPVDELDRLWRYGSADAAVPLDRLKGESWAKRRATVAAHLEAAAAEIAAAARRRGALEAPRLQPPARLYQRFAARFPYTPSPDQAAAIAAVLEDLAAGPPMDRLIAGDVGFGKTEVALRAAAAAAFCGWQVAVVAPTTVLARQHLETFRRRFAGFDVRVEGLSRLAAGGEAAATRRGLRDGSVGIVVGTTALLSDKVAFGRLGLLVIDEEQRFGEHDKARLRAMADRLHCLTMTATPIPRTLQGALVGVQAVSVIATPPVRRQPVRSFVLPFDPVVLREALQRERRRGGQSFVVVPRIADLAPLERQLAELVPELRLAVAHGRMKGEALAEVMVGFADGAADLLLATDIIEAGLDIPNANLIAICRADRFGLAQLHQLRGRVGRGRRRAVAYLFTDPGAPLSVAAERRLRTIETVDRLGAGFAISAHDLDLRGGGDPGGEAQAGHARLVGTELYRDLFTRALSAARGEPVSEWHPELRLDAGARIPEDYVPEAVVRLNLYRRLARLTDEAGIAALADELEDRFGPLPDSVERLLRLARLRGACRARGIAAIEAGPRGIALRLRPGAAQPPAAALAGEAVLEEDRLLLRRALADADERLGAAEALLAAVPPAEKAPRPQPPGRSRR
jgi:transcription-repair coupling factor (superfamily II helicase)